MDYKEKIKSRLYIGVIYIAVGIMMIVGTGVIKTDNDFISSLGLLLVVFGIVRIRNYFIITKDEKTLKKQQIAETDERNIAILHKAKSTAFSVYLLLSGTAVIILSLFGFHDIARGIAYSVLLLVIIYWICYLVYQKKS